MESNFREQLKLLETTIAEQRKQGKTDSFELEVYIIENMTDFYDEYPSIVKRLCREENQDNTMLYRMIETLEQVKKGEKSIETVELQLGHELAEKFVYPIIQEEENKKKQKHD
jgi:hypothetical protein